MWALKRHPCYYLMLEPAWGKKLNCPKLPAGEGKCTFGIIDSPLCDMSEVPECLGTLLAVPPFLTLLAASFLHGVPFHIWHLFNPPHLLFSHFCGSITKLSSEILTSKIRERKHPVVLKLVLSNKRKQTVIWSYNKTLVICNYKIGLS